MVSFFGDYDTTETIHIPFNTFDSNDPSASVTITDLVAGDIEIHKDGAVAQRTSDAGVTVSIDFDGITGNHMIHIDLSDNTDAGFYAAGSRYQVRIEGVTVDVGTLNSWVGAFSIGCTLRPTTAGRTLDIQATGEVDANLTMIATVSQRALDLGELAQYLIANAAVLQTVVADDSIIAQMLAIDGDISDYDDNTDSQEAIRDHIGDGTNLTEAGGDGDHLNEAGGDGDHLSNISLPAATLAQIKAQVVACLTTDTYAEHAAVPAATASLEEKITWLFMLARNKMLQTAILTTLRNDADGADVATSTVSDDAVTATRGEFT